MDNQNNHGPMCRCGWCGGGTWHNQRFSILRIFLALVLLGFVFHAGMEVGEFKGEIRAYKGNSWGMMRGGYMMSGYEPNINVIPSTVQTIPSATTTVR